MSNHSVDKAGINYSWRVFCFHTNMPPKRSRSNASSQSQESATPDAPVIKVIVRDANQKSGGLEIELSAEATVGDVKNKIAELHASKLAADSQKLVFAGQMPESTAKLADIFKFVCAHA
jgi:hypothetical protein